MQVDIKIFWYCSILRDYFDMFQIFCLLVDLVKDLS